MATTPQTNATLAGIAQVIKDHDNFVICGHVSPDGDCIGSQLALWHALRGLGKSATCVLVRDEPVERGLSFLPGVEAMVPAERFEGPCEVFVGLDVPIRERIGCATSLLDKSEVSITVDHHAVNTTMCQHVYVDPDSASTTMLVWELAKLLVGEPSLECATCAYTGLVTDTGGFRFQNCDTHAFMVASELVAYGVDPALIANWVFQTRTLASLKLESLVIGRMKLVAGGEGAISWVKKDDLESLGAGKADCDPLVNSVRSLDGVRVACILREQDDYVRGNLRSKDDTDVSVLARELGGGGHRAAAGITLHMPIAEAMELVADKISELLESTR